MSAASTSKVVVIVLNWNGLADTRACAQSLAVQTYQPVEVYLVDNGSTDGSVPALQAEFPQFTHIAHATNLGFTAANNLAIQRALDAGADFILLLNNDTEVAPDFLHPLVEAARTDPRVGMVVPKIYFHEPPNTIWYAGSKVDFATWYPFKHIGEGEADAGQYDVPRETGFVTACCALIRADLIRAIGALDPIFGYYCEDVDLSLRARAAGWRLRYEPRSRVWHKINRSIRRAGVDPYYYSCRNIAVVARRRFGPVRSIPSVVRAARWALQESRAPGRNRLALIEAARDAVIGRTGIVAQPGSSWFARTVGRWMR